MKKFLWSLIILIVGYFSWYLGAPLLIDNTVNEEFPGAFEMVEVTPSEELSSKIMEIMPEIEKMPKEEKEALEKKVIAKIPVKEVKEPMPTGPVLERTGSFVGADSFHKGSGKASVYKQNGSRLLRLDPFSVTNGPALHVYLTKHPAPRTSADVKQGFLDLGELKGNQGAQNYPIKGSTDGYTSVTIYCVPFGVVFATATF